MMQLLDIADTAAKTSLLLVVTACTSRLLRKRAAADRHVVWTAGLAGTFLLPVFNCFLPSWLHVSLFYPDEVSMHRVSQAWPRATVAVAPHLRASFLPAVEWLVPLLWLAGAAFVTGRWVVGQVGLRRWEGTTQGTISPEWLVTIHHEAKLAALRELHLFESAAVEIPLTWGLVHTVVMLPAAGAGWSEAHRRYALRHELAHVLRRDCLSEFVSCLARALHWYNPLVWFAARRQQRLAEQASDDFVLQSDEPATAYAQFLVDLAGRSGKTWRSFGACAMAGSSPMRERIISILDESARRDALTIHRRMFVLLLFGLLAFGLATISTVAVERPSRFGQNQSAVENRTPEASDLQSAPSVVSTRGVAEATMSRHPWSEQDPRGTHAERRVASEPFGALPALPASKSLPATSAITAVPPLPALPAWQDATAQHGTRNSHP